MSTSVPFRAPGTMVLVQPLPAPHLADLMRRARLDSSVETVYFASAIFTT
ncbi:hypothetical protein ACFWIJ_02545 [Streptomyces sp. NPDC127079]